MSKFIIKHLPNSNKFAHRQKYIYNVTVDSVARPPSHKRDKSTSTAVIVDRVVRPPSHKRDKSTSAAVIVERVARPPSHKRDKSTSAAVIVERVTSPLNTRETNAHLQLS